MLQKTFKESEFKLNFIDVLNNTTIKPWWFKLRVSLAYFGLGNQVWLSLQNKENLNSLYIWKHYENITNVFTD